MMEEYIENIIAKRKKIECFKMRVNLAKFWRKIHVFIAKLCRLQAHVNKDSGPKGVVRNNGLIGTK